MSIAVTAGGVRRYLTSGFPNIKPVSAICWIRPDSLAANGGVVSLSLVPTDANWALGVLSTGAPSVYISPSRVSGSAGSIVTGLWYNIAFTYGDNLTTNLAQVYLNGVMVASGTVSTPAIASGQFGVGDSEPDFGFVGGYNYLRVWNRELGSEEILRESKSHWGSGWWGNGIYGAYVANFNTNDVDQLEDISGNGHRFTSANGSFVVLYDDPQEPLSTERWFAPLSATFPVYGIRKTDIRLRVPI